MSHILIAADNTKIIPNEDNTNINLKPGGRSQRGISCFMYNQKVLVVQHLGVSQIVPANQGHVFRSQANFLLWCKYV